MATEIDADGAPIWRALADPTRRQILDLLRERPRITGDLASHFPISRIAVMRHLAVLSAAKLVSSRKRGRERWHYLNAIPLRQLYERWVHEDSEGWASGLLRLRRRAEAGGRRMSLGRPAVDVALDVSIAATPSAVFAALTRDPGAWWGHPYLRPDTTGLTLEPRLGGLMVETWSSGGAVLATVTGWTDDRYLELSGPFHLGVALGIAVFHLRPAEPGTSLQFSFQAFGVIDPAVVDRFAEGWSELVAHRLKAHLESGARLGVAPDQPA